MPLPAASGALPGECRRTPARSLASPALDYFLAICQALGIALAVGALAAAPGPSGSTAAGFAVAAAAAGAALAAVSMSADGESVAFAIPVGAAAGLLACLVTARAVAGACRRRDGGLWE